MVALLPLCVILINGAISQDAEVGPGPSCTLSFDDSCYNWVRDSLKFWEAEAFCNSIYQGHLLAINTREEHDFIRGRLFDSHLSDSMEGNTV